MAGGVDYEWRLRLLMAERGLFHTSELAPLLAERGVELSDSQVWRRASDFLCKRVTFPVTVNYTGW